jgi:2-succinyl-6-hydroxy-2,4-cyclohexadiene-1-carboxylate synthase
MILRGHPYHVKIEGAGPPLLLLHGFTGSLSTWDMLSEHLSTHFTVYRLDLMGHGETIPASNQRMRLTQQVKDLEVLLATRSEPWIVLGYSMGGRIALMLSVVSEQIARTIAVSTTPGIKTAVERKVRRASDRMLAERLEKDGLEAFIDHWETLGLFKPQALLKEQQRTRLRQERMSQTVEGLSASLREQGTGSMPSLWSCLPKEVDWIVGEEDEKFRTIALRASSPEKIHVILHASHAPQIDQPQKFVTMVKNLLIHH